jgi:uncharacterized lipoprotein YmbA
MMRFPLSYMIVSISLLLTACSSAPVHYYTLFAPSAHATEPTVESAEAAAFLIEVLPVGIPPQVDQMQLVVRQDASTINVLDNERWAAPLNEELRGALSIALAQRLATQEVTGLLRPSGKPVLRIKVEVRRFESRPGQYALLDADWGLSLLPAAENSRLLCHSQLREPVDGDDGNYGNLVRGHQQAVSKLADQIASTARNWMTSRQSTCPEVKG